MNATQLIRNMFLTNRIINRSSNYWNHRSTKEYLSICPLNSIDVY